MGKDISLNDCIDAKVWAQEWLKTIKDHPEIPTDEGAMIGWFANAIMAGYDKGAQTIKKNATHEYTSRYEASGIPIPDPETVCKGQCEGTGVVPIFENDMNEPWRTLWLAAEKEKPADDGWHFVKCPECNGTGKRQP